MNMVEHARELDLIAYAEGRIDADSARGREISVMLREDSSAMALVNAYRAQDDAIRRHYAPVLASPVPQHLQISDIQTARRQRSRGWLNWAGAAALVIGLGMLLNRGLTTSHVQTPSELDLFARRVAQHIVSPEVTHAIPTAESAGIVSPVLAGFELTTAQHALVDGERLSEVNYQSTDGQSLRLFIGEPKVSLAQSLHSSRAGESQFVYWQHQGRNYALLGDYLPAELNEIAARTLMEASSDSFPAIAGRAVPAEQAELLEDAPSVVPAVNEMASPLENIPTTLSEITVPENPL